MKYAGINGLSIIYVFTIVSFVSNINELLYLLYSGIAERLLFKLQGF